MVVAGLPLHAGVQPLIPLWLVLCVVMALPGEELQSRTESPWPLLDGGRSAGIQSWWGPESDHISWFWAWRVGGRWSAETTGFLGALANAKSRGAVPLLRKRAEWSWHLRWGSIVSCAAARAVASSLLELPRASSADGEVLPRHEVERDLHVAGSFL